MPVLSHRGLPFHWTYPFGGGSSSLRRSVRSVSAVYLRGWPLRASSTKSCNPTFTKRVRHLQMRATRVRSLWAISRFVCPSAPQRMICALYSMMSSNQPLQLRLLFGFQHDFFCFPAHNAKKLTYAYYVRYTLETDLVIDLYRERIQKPLGVGRTESADRHCFSNG